MGRNWIDEMIYPLIISIDGYLDEFLYDIDGDWIRNGL